MADFAHDYTTKEIEKLERRIHVVYKEAEADINRKLKDFEDKFAAKEQIHLQELKNGEITQEQYDNWRKGQEFQQKQWQSKRNSAINSVQNANQVAVAMVNGETPNIFAVNANYMAFGIERDAGIDFGFGVYDANSVANLIKNDPQILPKWKINEPKDYTWSKKKVNNAVTQGIIQGESLDKVVKRLTDKLVTGNENKMKTFARTAMTGAQNAGRQQSMKDAENLGIELEKEWMATLDSHTRDSHADIDGERVPVDSKFSNGLQYPGEAGGAPAEVYNCRCTMVTNVKKYPSIYSRRDNETGKIVNKLGPDTVENLTYNDWKMTKGITQTAKMIDERDKVTKTLQEVAGMGHGTVDGGLPFKYKSFDSAFRKVVGDTKEVIEENGLVLSRKEQFVLRTKMADKTADALRFTNISPPEHFVEDYNVITKELESRGFKTIRVKNTMGDHDVPYRGVNTLVQTPSGYVIGMQYHTPQSIDIKESVNHKIYEEVRKLDKNDPRVDELNKKMIDNMNSIVSPPNIETIKKVNYDTNRTKNVTKFGSYW